jgi:hypothetical protein
VHVPCSATFEAVSPRLPPARRGCLLFRTQARRALSALADYVFAPAITLALDISVPAQGNL